MQTDRFEHDISLIEAKVMSALDDVCGKAKSRDDDVNIMCALARVAAFYSVVCGAADGSTPSTFLMQFSDACLKCFADCEAAEKAAEEAPPANNRH